jgi:uncharacterized protein (DUF2062 family)
MWQKFKKYLPTPDSVHKESKFRWLANKLTHPELWSFEQKIIAKGVVIGLLAAFIPLPGQTPIAMLFAYLLRANLPFAIAMTWITNPLTFAPINYGIYLVGKWVTGDNEPYHPLTEFNWHEANFTEMCQHFWLWVSSMGKPFLVGIPIVAISCALIGYLLVYGIWKMINYKRRPKNDTNL